MRPSPSRATRAAGFFAAALAGAAPAAAYDMDCKVILCLAGGFPTGCADAKAYMMSRITARPPKPPFGHCAMSDGGGYDNHETLARWTPRTQAAGYYCAPGTQLYFSSESNDGDYINTAFCYTHTSTRRVNLGEGDYEDRVVYHGRSTAMPVNYEIQITVEPGTAQAFSSPTYAINFRTGFVGER